jgi:hypothetical protein
MCTAYGLEPTEDLRISEGLGDAGGFVQVPAHLGHVKQDILENVPGIRE